MARGRESQYIKTMTGRDEALLKQLSNTGLCSLEQAKTYCNLNRDRLVKLEKSGYVSIEKACPKDGSLIEVIRLDNKGRSYAENKLGQEYFYKTSVQQAGHDLKLTESYYQIMSEHPGATWANETQIKYEHSDQLIDGKDCIDGMVTLPNGESFAVEVVGEKYTQQTIDNKCAVGNSIAGNTMLVY